MFENDNINKVFNRETFYTYSSMHLNKQSSLQMLLKVFICELYDRHVHLSFILLCVTILPDNITNPFNLKGFNLVYTNLSDMTLGGMAIYENNKFDFRVYGDIVINIYVVFSDNIHLDTI